MSESPPATSCCLTEGPTSEKAPPSRPLVSVYEIANTTRKEFLVWIGDDGEEPKGAALETLRPVHWTAADHVIVNTIESGLKREEALLFRENYAKNLSHLPGWNIKLLPPL